MAEKWTAQDVPAQSGRVAVPHGDTVVGPGEHLDVVRAVADGDRVIRAQVDRGEDLGDREPLGRVGVVDDVARGVLPAALLAIKGLVLADDALLEGGGDGDGLEGGAGLVGGLDREVGGLVGVRTGSRVATSVTRAFSASSPRTPSDIRWARSSGGRL